jgi:hypothetical protein
VRLTSRWCGGSRISPARRGDTGESSIRAAAPSIFDARGCPVTDSADGCSVESTQRPFPPGMPVEVSDCFLNTDETLFRRRLKRDPVLSLPLTLRSRSSICFWKSLAALSSTCPRA